MLIFCQVWNMLDCGDVHTSNTLQCHLFGVVHTSSLLQGYTLYGDVQHSNITDLVMFLLVNTLKYHSFGDVHTINMLKYNSIIGVHIDAPRSLMMRCSTSHIQHCIFNNRVVMFKQSVCSHAIHNVIIFLYY